MPTILKHISAASLDEAERLLASLPRKVEIKSVSYAPLKSGGANQWVIAFCVDEWSVDPNLVKKPLNKAKEK